MKSFSERSIKDMFEVIRVTSEKREVEEEAEQRAEVEEQLKADWSRLEGVTREGFVTGEG